MDALVSIHSLLRWLVLLAAPVALVVALLSWFGSSTTDRQGRMTTLVYVALMDLQVLLGIVIWLLGNWWESSSRQFKFEHPLIMLIALIVIHVFAARARRSASLPAARARTIGIAISLVLVLIGIPWVR